MKLPDIESPDFLSAWDQQDPAYVDAKCLCEAFAWWNLCHEPFTVLLLFCFDNVYYALSLGTSIPIHQMAFESTSTFHHMASASSNDWNCFSSTYSSPSWWFNRDYQWKIPGMVTPSELFYLIHTRKSPVSSPKTPIKKSTPQRAPSPGSFEGDAESSFLHSLALLQALYTMSLLSICIYTYTYAWYKTYIMALLPIIMHAYAVYAKYIRAIDSIIIFAYTWYEWMHYLTWSYQQ